MKREASIKVGRRKGRIDIVTEKKAIEIERSGNPERIKWACQKLMASKKTYKLLRVPFWDLKKARKIATKVSSSIKVKNLSS